MSAAHQPSIHASCVLAGAGAVLIRGASGSGKSRLALELIQAAERGELPFARLVADDRTHLEAANGRLLARPAPNLAGLLELRHIGIRPLPFEPVATVQLVVDLSPTAVRFPECGSELTEIAGIRLPLLTLPAESAVSPRVLVELKHLNGRRRALPPHTPLGEK